VSLRRVARSVLYLAALLGGALLAHLTAPAPLPLAQVTPLFAPERAHAAESMPSAIALEPVEKPTALEPQPLIEVPITPHRAPAAYGGGRIIEGKTFHRLIFFTFDDGPDRRTTPLLLDRLDAVGVKAAFFLTAGRIAGRNGMEREQANIAREIKARGHMIGSHTVDHLQLPLLDDAAATAQLTGAEDIFQRVLDLHPVLIRPPGGSRSPRIDALLAQHGYTTVLWNLGAADYQVKDAHDLLASFRKVLDWREREHAGRGGIVLLHDTYAWSVDAFQLIWAELWARNCRLLARGEELYDIVPDLEFFYEARGTATASTPAQPADPAEPVLAERQARLRVETKQRCSATDGF
jgi:peptidoglycan/xylan/chitin deacetylase (PgdA/CDA1 family)